MASPVFGANVAGDSSPSPSFTAQFAGLDANALEPPRQ